MSEFELCSNDIESYIGALRIECFCSLKLGQRFGGMSQFLQNYPEVVSCICLAGIKLYCFLKFRVCLLEFLFLQISECEIVVCRVRPGLQLERFLIVLD